MGQQLAKSPGAKASSVLVAGDTLDLWTSEDEFEVSLERWLEEPEEAPCTVVDEILLEKAQGFTLAGPLLQYLLCMLSTPDRLALRLCCKALYGAIHRDFVTLSVKKLADAPKVPLPTYVKHLKHLKIDNTLRYDQNCRKLESWTKYSACFVGITSMSLANNWTYSGKSNPKIITVLSGMPWASQLTKLELDSLDDPSLAALDLRNFPELLELRLGQVFSSKDPCIVPRVLSAAPASLTALSLVRMGLEERQNELMELLSNLKSLEIREPPSSTPNGPSKTGDFLLRLVEKIPLEQLKFSYAFLELSELPSSLDISALKVLHGSGSRGIWDTLTKGAVILREVDWQFRSINEDASFDSMFQLVRCNPMLTKLKLGNGGRTVEFQGGDAFGLSSLRHLEVLSMGDWHFSSEMWDALREAKPPLTSLHVWNTTAELPSMNKCLRGLPLLESCSLRDIDNDTLHCLSGCANLCYLYSSGSAVDCYDDGMIALANGCSAMIDLTLYEAKNLTDASLIAIAEGMRSLRNLDASVWSLVTDTGVIAIAKCCRQLECLTMVYCPLLTNVSLRALHKYLNNDTFQELRVGGSQIDDNLARKWTEQARFRGKYVSAKADFYD